MRRTGDEDVGRVELGEGARDAAEGRAPREERALDLGRIIAEAAGADARRGSAAVGAEAVGRGGRGAEEQRDRGAEHGRVGAAVVCC